MGPLLAWCLRIIDDLAPDILIALDAYRVRRETGRPGWRHAAGRVGR